MKMTDKKSDPRERRGQPLIPFCCYFGRLWLSISHAMCEVSCQYRKCKRQFFAERDRHWFQIANNQEVMPYYSWWRWHFKEITNNKQCLLGVIVRRSSIGSRYNSCFQTPDAWMNSCVFAWWRHQMEAFSALLTLVRGISPVKRLKSKRLRKQSCGWWFETPSLSLWRHCNVVVWYGGSVNILF